MADQNNLSKPDATSNYATEVWQTLSGHIIRLWKDDYTGMGGLVAGMRRWVNVGAGEVKLVQRNSGGTEDTLFDSSTKAPLVSPVFSGTPQVPTAALNSNNKQAASTAYVQAQIANDALAKSGSGLLSISTSMPMPAAQQVRVCEALNDGTVLVCTSTVIYQFKPKTARWSSMASPSPAVTSDSSGCRLADGRVFVHGVGVARIYNPASNTWASAATPPVNASEAAVALLGDGRVLVCGGYYGGSPLNSVRVYNPTINTWSEALAVLPTAKYRSRAVSLSDGRVLVAGGLSASSALKEVHVYDPTSNTWTAKSSLPTPKYNVGISRLLDGRVLVTNGSDLSSSYAESHVYSPDLDNWTPAASLPVSTMNHGSTTLADGRIFVCGGFCLSSDTDATYFYNPTI